MSCLRFLGLYSYLLSSNIEGSLSKIVPLQFLICLGYENLPRSNRFYKRAVASLAQGLIAP